MINHKNGQVDASDSRMVLDESARIARGKVNPLAALDPDNFDAILFPGNALQHILFGLHQI